MSADEVARIRFENMKTTISRVFLDENSDVAKDSVDKDIPNPIERFEQCFSEYPDLLGKQ